MFAALVASSFLGLGQAGPALEKPIVIPSQAPIVQALFNPDGRRIYFATYAGIEGHDIETGKRLFDAAGGHYLVVSPKGDRLAAVFHMIGMISISGHVTVLDAATGKKLHTVAGTSATFSPDSRWLVSHSRYTWGRPATDEAPKVQITDLHTGKTHLAQFVLAKGVNSVNPRAVDGHPIYFTNDSKTLVGMSRDKLGKFAVLTACDLATGKALEKLPAAEDVHVRPDPSTSGDGKRFVRDWTVFDAAQAKAIAKLEPYKHPESNGWYPHFQISADGKSVFSVSSSRRQVIEDEKTGRTKLKLASHLHVWDADSGKWKHIIADARRTVDIPTVTIKKVGRYDRSEPMFAINPQGTRAVDYDTESATVWDLTTGKPLRTMRTSGLAFRPEILRFSPDGQWIASASTAGEVALFDARSGKPGPAFDRAPHLGDVCFRPKTGELIGVGHGLIHVWDIKTGAMKRTMEQQGNLFRVECHPDGKRIAISDHWSDTVRILDIETGKSLHRLTGKGQSLAFHPGGESLLTLDLHGTTALWDVASGKRLQYWQSGKMNNALYSAKRVVFLPGAARFLLCENDAVAIVDAATGKREREHSLKNDARLELSDADNHPDGKRFVVVHAYKKEFEERDLETGKILRTYPGHPNGSTLARYSPDGARLVTAGAYAYEMRIHTVSKIQEPHTK